MECLNCETRNEPDSRFCRRCGVSVGRCAACAVLLEADALYCRRCGKSTKQLQEDRAAAPEAQGPGAANAPDFDSDVDFTTKITPRRVEPLGRAGGLRRLMRAASYAAAVLLTAAALTVAVAAVWGGVGVPPAVAPAPAETWRADLEEFKRMVVETKDADRRAILQEVGLVLARMKADERRSTREEIRKAIAGAQEDERKLISEEISKAVAKAREQERSFVIAELTKLKARTKNREFTRQLEGAIALFKTRAKPATATRRGHDG